MLKKTKEKMIAYAETLPASANRAQCYNIANLVIGQHETIANALKADHRSQDGAKRAALLMVSAGCATEKETDPSYFGVFTFEDGSKL